MFKQVNIVITVYNNVYNPPKILRIRIHTSVHDHVNSLSKFKMSVQTSGGSKFVSDGCINTRRKDSVHFFPKMVKTHLEHLLYESTRYSLCVCSNSSSPSGQFFSKYSDTSISRTSFDSIFCTKDDRLVMQLSSWFCAQVSFSSYSSYSTPFRGNRSFQWSSPLPHIYRTCTIEA